MANLEKLTVDDFAPHTGSEFSLQVPEGQPITLTLREATQLGQPAPGWRHGFSLQFGGPKTPALPQQVYSMGHDVIGDMDIFIVPIGETAEERQYEAIFN